MYVLLRENFVKTAFRKMIILVNLCNLTLEKNYRTRSLSKNLVKSTLVTSLGKALI